MKRIYILIAAVLLTASVFAQSPEKMSYQAVVRDASNNLVTSQSIGMQVSILQGSANGTVTYMETITSATNVSGLVTVEIGTGTIVSGDFSVIDWSAGPYFIKTETDPTGGTSYTITGTTQLMSVPYALYAKNSGSSTPGPQGAVGTTGADGLVGPTGAEGNDGADGVQGLTGATGAQGIAGNTGAQGPTGLNGTDGADGTNNTIYAVGDFTQGGIVFWVDDTGEHGLVATKDDQSTGIRWHAGTNGSTQAKGDQPFSGEMNTAIIIAAHVAIGDDGNTYGARLCAELQITENGKTYGDWYLPSRQELILLASNENTINTTATANGGSNFAATGRYWSSTEGTSTTTWTYVFGSGSQQNSKVNLNYVRAIRAF